MFSGLKVMQTRTPDTQIRELLSKERFNKRHFQIGRLVLALMVLGSLVGITVEYFSNDKLLINPHLTVGINMIIIVLLSVAIIPFMQKVSLLARRAHASLNMIMMTLSLWQVLTGMQLINEIKESHLI